MSHSLWAGKQEADKLALGGPVAVVVVTFLILIFTFEGVMHYTRNAVAEAPRRVSTTDSHRVEIASNGEPLRASQIPEFGMLHQTLFDAVSDAKDLHVVAEERLHSYGWLDAKKTTAHIPIERAMKMLIAQRAQGK